MASVCYTFSNSQYAVASGGLISATATNELLPADAIGSFSEKYMMFVVESKTVLMKKNGILTRVAVMRKC